MRKNIKVMLKHYHYLSWVQITTVIETYKNENERKTKTGGFKNRHYQVY